MPIDATLRELALKAFLPANAESALRLRQIVAEHPTPVHVTHCLAAVVQRKVMEFASRARPLRKLERIGRG